MGKYNLCATKEDWENLYKEVEALGFDVKHFKKSQSFDSALVQLDIMKDKKEENKMTCDCGNEIKEYPEGDDTFEICEECR